MCLTNQIQMRKQQTNSQEVVLCYLLGKKFLENSQANTNQKAQLKTYL